MKMIDRIRKVRNSAEAREFVGLWERYREDENALFAHEAVRMIDLGRRMDRAVAEAVKAHLDELVPTGVTHPRRSSLLVMEVGRARDRALRKVFPELPEFLDFVVKVLTEPKEEVPA